MIPQIFSTFEEGSLLKNIYICSITGIYTWVLSAVHLLKDVCFPSRKSISDLKGQILVLKKRQQEFF